MAPDDSTEPLFTQPSSRSAQKKSSHIPLKALLQGPPLFHWFLRLRQVPRGAQKVTYMMITPPLFDDLANLALVLVELCVLTASAGLGSGSGTGSAAPSAISSSSAAIPCANSAVVGATSSCRSFTITVLFAV